MRATQVARRWVAWSAPRAWLDARAAPDPEARLAAALATIRADWRLDDPGDEPVFVFGSGWRSGSTMVQRLIVAGGEVHLWGEPWARGDPVRRLAESLASVEPGYPPPEHFLGAHDGSLGGAWIANLSPDPATLLDAHRTFLRTFLRPPVASQRWGLKEVRFGGVHARYLATLFPRAKFVFIHRDPTDQWASYARWGPWHERWPTGRIRTPAQFGAMWRRLTEGVLGAGNLDVLAVPYDDLLAKGESLDRLGEFLGAAIDPSVLEVKVGSSTTGRAAASTPRSLWRAVEPVATSLGYRRR